MGIQITPIFNINRSNFEVDNMTVNDNFTADTASVNSLSISSDGGILQVVKCTASETVFTDNPVSCSRDKPVVFSDIILPFVPSHYYSGTICCWYTSTATLTVTGIKAIMHNVDGTKTDINITKTKTAITIPFGTIAVQLYVDAYPTTFGNFNIYAGFTNEYIPLIL